MFFESIADNIFGKNDRCGIGACNNSRKYRDKQVILPHITAFDGNKELRFWKCSDVRLFQTCQLLRFCRVSQGFGLNLTFTRICVHFTRFFKNLFSIYQCSDFQDV